MLKIISDKSVHEENIEDLQNILNTSELNTSSISKCSTNTDKRKPVYVKKKILAPKEL